MSLTSEMSVVIIWGICGGVGFMVGVGVVGVVGRFGGVCGVGGDVEG